MSAESDLLFNCYAATADFKLLWRTKSIFCSVVLGLLLLQPVKFCLVACSLVIFLQKLKASWVDHVLALVKLAEWIIFLLLSCPFVPFSRSTELGACSSLPVIAAIDLWLPLHILPTQCFHRRVPSLVRMFIRKSRLCVATQRFFLSWCISIIMNQM